MSAAAQDPPGERTALYRLHDADERLLYVGVDGGGVPGGTGGRTGDPE